MEESRICKKASVRRGSAVAKVMADGHGFAKRRVGPDWSRICKVRGGKNEACQGFCGLGLKACSPARKRGAAPL